MAKNTKIQKKTKPGQRAKKGKICPCCGGRLKVGLSRCYNCEPGGVK